MARTRRSRIARTAVALACAVLAPLSLAVAGEAPQAKAEFWPAGIDVWVDSEMGPIKSRLFRAADGNTRRTVYALDGMRARPDLNGWEIETNIAQMLTKWNINVVMPVGGQSSFYTDWIAPSTQPLGGSSGSAAGSPLVKGLATGSGSGSASGSANQQVTYKWETYLTRDLPDALRSRFGLSSTRNGIFGLSMAGSSALAIAAHHPRQFSYAGAFSAALNLSAPGMPEMIRVALLEAGGYNVDCMWGPPWSPLWRRNDPFMLTSLLRRNGVRVFIASGNGVPSFRDLPMGVMPTVYGMGLEALTFANTQAFRAKMLADGNHNAVWNFAPVGVHNWRYWVDDVNGMAPDLSAHIG